MNRVVGKLDRSPLLAGSDTACGDPNLSDREVEGLISVLHEQASVGRLVSAVIRPGHDHERVQLDSSS
jgi:hypothetical protein